jgi:hypothetical protein
MKNTTTPNPPRNMPSKLANGKAPFVSIILFFIGIRIDGRYKKDCFFGLKAKKATFYSMSIDFDYLVNGFFHDAFLVVVVVLNYYFPGFEIQILVYSFFAYCGFCCYYG